VNYGYENGMPHIIADAIYEDKQHRLWIGTRNGMAQVKAKHCVVYPVDDKQDINFVFRFYQLHSGELWALTSKGVYQFEKDYWKKIKLYPGLENYSCRNIVETDSGIILNYPYHLVIKKNNGSIQLLKEIRNNKSPDPFFSEIFQKGGHLYINMIYGLYEIKGKDTVSIFKDELIGKYILLAYLDRSNRYWVYTLHDQLMVSEPGNNQHFFYKKPMQLVSSFCEDREGNMWVAGVDGLLKMKALNYENYEKSFSPEIDGNCSILKTPDNRLLISGASNNVFTISPGNFNKRTRKFLPIKQSAGHKEIIDGSCTDDQGRMWLIFRDQRDLFLMQNNKLKLLEGLVKRNIHQLTGVAFNEKTHRIYVCADTLQSGNENRMETFESTNGKKHIVAPTCIHYFSNGRMLIGTTNSGFFIMDDKENVYPISEKVITSYDAVGSIFFFDEPSGKFWIASSHGLVRYKWDEKMTPVKDIVVTTKQGLPNNGVRSLAFDRLNRIWAATLSGIVVIEIDSSANNTVRINRLSEEQGINSEFWAEARLATDADGNIWAGLSNQLLKFDPSKVEFEKKQPSVAIDNIQLNSKETNWSQWTDSTEGIMQIPYQPILPHNKNNIGISYKGISFSYASGLEYSYRLEGADSNWSSPTISNFVSFVGLPAGKYDFQVKARKSNSDWSIPAVFSFTILKPFWATLWFRILVITAAATIIYFFYKYRINQLKRVFALRTKISRDLHDEVGSTLSGIGIISEMAKHQLEKDKSNELVQSLDKISANTGEMLEKMSDIIWAINPQNDSFEKMVNRLETYTKNIALPLGIQLHLQSDKAAEKINPDMQQLNNVYLICKEAINNSLKYSGCKNLYVVLRNEDHHLHINIYDDGKGFDPQGAVEGNGLKNMRSRAMEIKAELKIDSGLNQGASIKLSLNIT
jgi:ligand-binding sensor domain-containing protein